MNNQLEAHYLKTELYTLIQNDPLIFDFLQQGTLDGLWYWDLNAPEHEWMSPEFWLLLGYNPNEMPHLASAWQDIIFAEDLKIATYNFQQHLNNPSHPYDQIVRYRHKDGSTVWVRCRGIAIHDTSGQPVRMLGAHNDYTLLMEKQQEALKTKLEIDQNDRLISQLKNSHRAAEAQLEDINHKLQTGELINTQELIKPPGAFYHLLKERSQLCLKLNLPITLIILSVNNIRHIESSLGAHARTEIINIIARTLNQTIDSAIISIFNASELVAADLGTELAATQALLHQVNQQLKDYRWLSIAPQITLQVNSFDLTSALNNQAEIDALILQTHQHGQHII